MSYTTLTPKTIQQLLIRVQFFPDVRSGRYNFEVFYLDYQTKKPVRVVVSPASFATENEAYVNGCIEINRIKRAACRGRRWLESLDTSA